MLKITTNLKNISYEDKETWDNMIEYYPIKKNLIISRLSSVQKGTWHQSQRIISSSDTNAFNKLSPEITKLQIIGCKYFLLYFSKSFEYYYIFLLYSFIYFSLNMYFCPFNYWLLYNYTPFVLLFCDFGGEGVERVGVGWGCGPDGWCKMPFCTLLIFKDRVPNIPNQGTFSNSEGYQ